MHRHAVDLDNRTAKDIVAIDDFVQRRFQMPGLQRAFQAHGTRKIVRGAVGVQLLHEPQALLREREWRRGQVGAGGDALELHAGIGHQQRQHLIIE